MASNWESLSHKDKVNVLASSALDQVVQDYTHPTLDATGFKELLQRELKLWDPRNVDEFKTAGHAPTKDVVFGAWRDLDRSEALLELIDNSIDVWFRRHEQHPGKAA